MTDQRRQKLLEAKLGDLLTWTKPEIAETIGPHDPSIFERYDTLRQRVISGCVEELRQYSDNQISSLLGETPDDSGDARSRWNDFLRHEIRRLNPPPPWYAGGFGHPDHVADFEYWSRMANFTGHELLCLSVGAEPASFKQTDIEKFSMGDLSRLRPTVQFLVRRSEQLNRQFSHGNRALRVSPRIFVYWAGRVAFEAHPEFLRLLRLHHVEGAHQPARASAPERQDPREVDKIAQLFTAMAIDHLGYDPKQARSPIPKEIADLAASMGLEVSSDTVRKYLKLGASFIADDWKPE